MLAGFAIASPHPNFRLSFTENINGRCGERAVREELGVWGIGKYETGIKSDDADAADADAPDDADGDDMATMSPVGIERRQNCLWKS